jgi:hypothetical protein
MPSYSPSLYQCSFFVVAAAAAAAVAYHSILSEFVRVLFVILSLNRSVDIAARLWAGQLRDRGLIPGRCRDFPLHDIHTGSGAHPLSYTIGTGALSLGVKLTIHLQLVPKLRMVELYLHSLICLHGMVL